MEISSSRNQVRLWILASVICYLGSLVSKAYCTDGTSCVVGFLPLVLGWFYSAVDPIAGLPWLANPLLIMGWILCLLFLRGPAVVTTVGSLLCSLMFLGTPGVLQDEGGSVRRVTSLEIGYWLWLASCALACVAAWLSANLDHPVGSGGSRRR